jgi:demethylmenaquinone methyltransferase/2-methoxy-6-polyprenyl-1,4-benzoquinol methylase
MPLIGKWVAKDADSYRYLAESIRMHPDQADAEGHDEGRRLRPRGRARPGAGVVALHVGIKC